MAAPADSLQAGQVQGATDHHTVVVASDPQASPTGTAQSTGETIPVGEESISMVLNRTCWHTLKQLMGHAPTTGSKTAKSDQLKPAREPSPGDSKAGQHEVEGSADTNMVQVPEASGCSLGDMQQPSSPDSQRPHQLVFKGAQHIVRSCMSTTQNTLHIFKISPACWIVPLMLLALMLGLGIWGVEQGAKAEQEHTQDMAKAASEGVAKSFELQLQQTYAPCVTLALMVQQHPNWFDLRPVFLSMAPTLMAQVPSDSLLEIQFAPQGIITDSYPEDVAASGKDLFQVDNRRAIAIETVQQGTLTVAGPLPLFRGGLGLMARIPVFLDNQTAEETYGLNHSTTDCDICYNPVTKRKFWGFSIAIITWSKLVGPNSTLAALTNLDYSWALREADPMDPSQMVDISSSPTPLNEAIDNIKTVINLRPPNLQSPTSTPSFTDKWYLHAQPRNGWVPVWKPAAMAGTIVGAFVVAMLVSAVMVNRMHQVLALQDLKEANVCLADTTKNLKTEKDRLDALLERQYGLIAMFEKDSGARSLERRSGESVTMERIEAMRRSMQVGGGRPANTTHMLQLQVLELLGEGTFGKVYKGLWRGTKVAIKTLILPANMSGAEKREKMAIMEAAISSSLSHPNIVQTYTYAVKPLKDTVGGSAAADNELIIATSSSTVATTHPAVAGAGFTPTTSAPGAATAPSTPPSGTAVAPSPPPLHAASVSAVGDGNAGLGSASSAPASALNAGLADTEGSSEHRAKASNVHSYEVRLVLEYCDKGTLRDAVEQGAFFTRTGLNYPAILDTALDIAQAMLHLHSMDILHGDLKARNILLKSCGDEPRGVIAKVGDFGLSVKIDQHATHISSVFQGTMTHMAPEVMLHGHISKAADVYAFGITLFELFTGSKPFSGVPGALLGHMITSDKKRPAFPPMTPFDYRALAERCWAPEPSARPTFEEIATELNRMRAEKAGTTLPLVIKVAAPIPLQPDGEQNLRIDMRAPVAGTNVAVTTLPMLDAANPAMVTSSINASLVRSKQVRWLEPLPEAGTEGVASSPSNSGSKLAQLMNTNTSHISNATSGTTGTNSPPTSASRAPEPPSARAAFVALPSLASPTPLVLHTSGRRSSATELSPSSGQLLTRLGLSGSGASSQQNSNQNLSQPLSGGSDRGGCRAGVAGRRLSGHMTPPRSRNASASASSGVPQLGYVVQSGLEPEAPALIIGEVDEWAEGCSSMEGTGQGPQQKTLALSSTVVAQIAKLVSLRPVMLPRIDEGSTGRTSSEVNSTTEHVASGTSFHTARMGSNGGAAPG